jgi:hypothetical protein
MINKHIKLEVAKMIKKGYTKKQINKKYKDVTQSILDDIMKNSITLKTFIHE